MRIFGLLVLMRHKLRIILVGSILTLLTCSAFLPELASGVWHLRHLSFFAPYRTWAVPIPWGWFQYGDENSLIVDRLNRFFPRENGSRVFVFSYDTKGQGDLSVDAWKRGEIEEMHNKGFDFSGEESMQSAGNAIPCIVFHKNHEPRELYITCDIRPDHLAIDYEGRAEDLRILRTILAGIRKTPA
jgi:hypothetical protein